MYNKGEYLSVTLGSQQTHHQFFITSNVKSWFFLTLYYLNIKKKILFKNFSSKFSFYKNKILVVAAE